MRVCCRHACGFTLAELLIALAILGVIATFTIPKVLQSQQSSQWNSSAKEAIGMLSGAYSAYKQSNVADGSTTFAHLTPFMNYVKVLTNSQVADDHQTAGSINCSGQISCLQLHNGGTIWYRNDQGFGSTDVTSGIWVNFDPDSSYPGNTTGPGKAVNLWLYANGRITTKGEITPNTCNVAACFSPVPAHNPPWFSWN